MLLTGRPLGAYSVVGPWVAAVAGARNRISMRWAKVAGVPDVLNDMATPKGGVPRRLIRFAFSPNVLSDIGSRFLPSRCRLVRIVSSSWQRAGPPIRTKRHEGTNRGCRVSFNTYRVFPERTKRHRFSRFGLPMSVSTYFFRPVPTHLAQKHASGAPWPQGQRALSPGRPHAGRTQ